MNCKGLAQENCVPPCKYVNGAKRKYCMTSRKKTSVKAPSVKTPSVKAPSVKTPSVKTPSVKRDCKGLDRENCLEPDCKYVNGAKRKYCMNSKKKAVKAVKAAKTVKAAREPERVEPFNSLEKARNKIGRFMLKKRDNITSHFLTSVCNDSGVCIAFGKETDKIKKFFNNFDFEYKKSVKELSKGANGIVYEVEYERLKYIAFTIIKTAQKKTSDNLVYEYLVGMLFINKYYKKFPCFLETYNWCLLPKTPQPVFFNTVDVNAMIDLSCKNPTDVGIQIEYLKSPKTIKSVLDSLPFWRNDILQVLFQIYFPLVCLRTNFTHYDLHYNNVLLHAPIKDHYISFHYHGQKTFSFKSQYITKIIDYGRCFFKTDISSLDIREQVCKTPKCNKKTVCGSNLGYGFLKRPGDKGSSFINSSISNISHDLRLLYYVSQSYANKSNDLLPLYDTFSKLNNKNTVDTFFKNIIYTGPKNGSHIYGTKENKIRGFPSRTNNITDAWLFLGEICSSPGFKLHNDSCYDDPLKKIGDLHVYSDGRNMEFIPR